MSPLKWIISRQLNHFVTFHVKDKNYKCDICEKVFGSELLLNLHDRQTHDVIRKQCDICEKTYKLTSELKMHIAKDHDRTSQKSCEFCGGIYGDKKSLKRHVKIVHQSEKGFQMWNLRQIL